ncbi:uncharacterized protein FA14DRAFT_5168 [Meira miltonrushii]|uniref:Uncharacterized protein n=1 Tax=Meira miltonrushii TaxID=1280837 RepID=A0A316VK18_9BASI|nr:uncharacterized protein FA14DRAFT_5168 [Meira miltonrushii]PWN36653.1 hypothetical protein FA14DRAFT_5168 [Meira miltonrushii]
MKIKGAVPFFLFVFLLIPHDIFLFLEGYFRRDENHVCLNLILHSSRLLRSRLYEFGSRLNEWASFPGNMRVYSESKSEDVCIPLCLAIDYIMSLYLKFGTEASIL